jgi:GT2 family glycosyltransferase
MATRMSIVDEVGGFDEALAIDYNDIDFCLRVYDAGYRNIYTPFAALYHFESVSAVRHAPSGTEHDLFMQRWRNYMSVDPYYNPNLSRITPDFAPADLSFYR